MIARHVFAAAAVLGTAAVSVSAQAEGPVRLLDVPYIQQSEALCGGAAAAMVMRYWGAADVYAESFAPLLDPRAGGIRAQDLLDDLQRRGWDARSFEGDPSLVQGRLSARQPVVALIEDRPGAFHFVVVVAWTAGRVVYHDPARAPFRIIEETAFDAVWQKSNRWTMLALPPPGGPAAPSVAAGAGASSPATACTALVQEGVNAAGAGDHPRALAVFSSAADLCPGDAAPHREAAGVYALASKWSDAASHARAALQRDRSDEHAWRILATSEYVMGNAAAALTAWNAVGEPRIDLVTVQGLDRTRHAVATRLLNLSPGTPLTSGALAAAGQRLGELPSAEVARTSYTPAANGRANVEAVVVERPLLPSSRGSLLTLGAQMLTDRELAIRVASPTGGGESITAAWRWWEERPRVSLAAAVPSAAGIWRAEVFGEKQTYGPGHAGGAESRRSGSVALSNWTQTLLRWEVGATFDAWRGEGRTAGVHAGIDQRLAADTISLEARAGVLGGAFTASTFGAGLQWRSRPRHEGFVLLAGGGGELASARAPRALWPGAGTGHARGPLLRAHPLLEDGTITGAVFGRTLYHAGAEARAWSGPVLKIVRLAPAVFVDAARAERRATGGDAWHVDVGVGLRMAVAGARVFRLDVAKGLRDGRTALSIAWVR